VRDCLLRTAKAFKTFSPESTTKREAFLLFTSQWFVEAKRNGNLIARWEARAKTKPNRCSTEKRFPLCQGKRRKRNASERVEDLEV
jgi:MoaA/NifB/PqqE/SkfB family radical SAM enzyme